jgi:hypothetical protein
MIGFFFGLKGFMSFKNLQSYNSSNNTNNTKNTKNTKNIPFKAHLIVAFPKKPQNFTQTFLVLITGL